MPLHFSQYIKEATSMDDNLLGHLTHVKDIPHESPGHVHAAIDMLRKFHDHRQGKRVGITASLKHDGGASVHVVHHEDGRVGVSDKHRLARNVIAYSDEEVDKHFGKHPEYANTLKHLRAHGSSVVARGHHVQGDVLWSGHNHDNEGITKYTPNRIGYHAKSKAPLGIAIHTEVKGGKAKAVSKEATHSSEHVFVPKAEFHPDEHHYDDKDREKVEHHLEHAEKLAKEHDTTHMTPEHVEHLTIYHNRVARGHREPSAKGYATYLRMRGETESEKLKTTAGQNRTRAKYEGLAKHVEENSHHFERSIAIRHHLQKATDHVLNGIEHPDLKTSIDDKPSRGEGVVLHNEDGKPLAKLVHSDVQHALGNNPRFPSKGAINESAATDKHVHAFYGKVQYATIGHKSAIDQMREAAKKDGASTAVGLSNTPGPLGIKGKKEHAEAVFKHKVDTGEEHTKDFIKYVSHLHRQGHTHLTIHAGSDRADDYQKILDRYNGKPTKSGETLFHFKSAKVRKVGSDREEGEPTKDPRDMNDHELLKTAKASRLRNYAKDGSEESRQRFHAYHKPLGMSHDEVEKHWNNLKGAMKNINEVWSKVKQSLQERVISPGFNSDHEKYREKYREQIHSAIRNSYASIGGYGGHGAGTEKESAAIHDDIGNPKHAMKLTRRNGKITSVALYKLHKGRKSIVFATDGSDQGKRDLRKTMEEDNELKRAWGEASGAVARLKDKMGYPKVPSSKAKELTGKSDIKPTDEFSYTRSIGGHPHTKTIYGHPKD